MADVTIESVTGAALTIAPGTVLRLNEGAQLDVGGSSTSGTLIANGTSAEPIVFTSNQTTHTAGWWDHLRFLSGAVGCELEYCLLEYGGGNTYGERDAIVYIWTYNPVLVQNCRVENSYTNGIKIVAGTTHSVDGTYLFGNANGDTVTEAGGSATGTLETIPPFE